MSPESAQESEPVLPLRTLFERMSPEEQSIIRNHLFNDVGSLPLDSALDELTRPEDSRAIAQQLDIYLDILRNEDKQDKEALARSLKGQAEIILGYIGRRVADNPDYVPHIPNIGAMLR